MAGFRTLAPGVLVSGQIRIEDVASAAGQGVGRIVNNRPDDEEPGQPSSSDIEAAARAAGLDYVFAPVRGLPDPTAVAAVAAALQDGKPTLFYCRSGTRSATAWALAMRQTDRMDAAAIREQAAGAGYDLSLLPL